ncbi:MAG: hypothetical protein V4714_19745 [Bacteroidota bacterium]
MRIIIRTPVKQSYQQVWASFGRDLFLKLAPPFPPVKLIRFDGCQTGDIVSMELNFLLFRQVWESAIVAQESNSEEIYFIDEGRKLPFFLQYWHHRHRILRRGAQAEIIDDITFRSPFRLLDFLLYPVLYLQFVYRRPIYKKLFR